MKKEYKVKIYERLREFEVKAKSIENAKTKVLEQEGYLDWADIMITKK